MPDVTGTLKTPRLASAPATPVVGQMYYNTTTNLLQWWNGTAWVSASGGAGTAPVNYTGSYNAATVYHDGDYVVDANGVTYQCVKEGTVGVAPAPWTTGNWGVPQPPVNGQFLKGVSGAAVWSALAPADVTGSNLATADTSWHIVGNSGEPAFQNGFAAWDTRVPRFRKLATGLVLVAGILRCPAAYAAPVFTLPVGYRIGNSYGDVSQPIIGSGVVLLANANSLGAVAITQPSGAAWPANSWCYLDGLYFFAEP